MLQVNVRAVVARRATAAGVEGRGVGKAAGGRGQADAQGGKSSASSSLVSCPHDLPSHGRWSYYAA